MTTVRLRRVSLRLGLATGAVTGFVVGLFVGCVLGALTTWIAGALLDWLIEEARRLGCGQLHLDSGVGPDREDAHRLYLNKRLRISAHHFQLDL